jgi:hypothetical protein
MPAPAHYCYINTTIPIVADILPDPALKKVHQFQCHLELPLEENNVQHVVNAHMWTAEPPIASEVVNWLGSFAHPGDLSKDADIFVTSVEHFPWADMDGELYDMYMANDRLSTIWTRFRRGSPPW